MEKFKLAVICILCYGCSTSFGQTAISKSVTATNILSRLGNSQSYKNYNLTPGDILVWPHPDESGDIVGDTYWDIHWSKATILLYDKEQLLEGYLTRLDISKSELEFKFDNGMKVMPGKLIKNIVWIDSVMLYPHYMVNAKDYKVENVPLVGFLEVLADGENALFKRIQIEVLKPNYSVALNVGSKDTEILKKETYYFNIKNELYKIKSKKSMEIILGDKADEINAFIKSEGIKFNDEEDLIKLFKQFNSVN